MKNMNPMEFKQEIYGLPLLQYYMSQGNVDDALQYFTTLVHHDQHGAFVYPDIKSPRELRIPYAIFYAIRKNFFAVDTPEVGSQNAKQHELFLNLLKFASPTDKSIDMNYSLIAEAIWLGQPECANFIALQFNPKDPAKLIRDAFYEDKTTLLNQSDSFWKRFFKFDALKDAVCTIYSQIITKYYVQNITDGSHMMIMKLLPTDKIKLAMQHPSNPPVTINTENKRLEPLDKSIEQPKHKKIKTTPLASSQ